MTGWESVAPFLLLLVVFVSLGLYMLLDGFDLGVGTLALTETDDEHRHRMVESIVTVWDGNESWLVLAGAALFAGFPLAFGTILPALYVPLVVMLLALVFRGVSFEFQAQHEGYDRRWGVCFSLGSLLAAFSQGVALGALLGGVAVSGGAFAGGPLDFLTPFSVIVGVFVTALYSLSGAGWLVFKTGGSLMVASRRKGRALAVVCAALLPVVLAGVSVWSPFAENAVSGGRLPYVAVAVAVALAAMVGAYLAFGRRDDALPPLCASLALAALIVGGVVAAYPYLVPGITYAEAAAPTSSSTLMLAVVVPLILVTIAYNAYAYWIFRGKLGAHTEREEAHPDV
jgi:cytochrome bd ubiquinol oxidase subunit II